jgi:hypothetical protein
MVSTALLSTMAGPFISHSAMVPALSRHSDVVAQVADVGDAPLIGQRADDGVADGRRRFILRSAGAPSRKSCPLAAAKFPNGLQQGALHPWFQGDRVAERPGFQEGKQS